MKFTRIVTVTQVRRKIALAFARDRCPRCGYELPEKLEMEEPDQPKLSPADSDKGEKKK